MPASAVSSNMRDQPAMRTVLVCALASLQHAMALSVVACAMPGPVARGLPPIPSPAQLLAKHARLAPMAAAAAPRSRLLRRAEAFQTQNSIYGSAIAACADSGEWRGACALISELDSLGLSIAGRPLTGALRATARAGEWDATMRLRSMAMARNVPISRGGYSHIIGVAVATGHNETAAQVYALALQHGKFRHWRQNEPMTIDLHGFSQPVAVTAVRHALKYEIGNYLKGDLKIVTGRGRHSEGGVARLRPRVEALLRHELRPPLRYTYDSSLECDENSCTQTVNRGCLVVWLPDLFSWVVATKAYDTYVLTLPWTDPLTPPPSVGLGPA